MAKKDKQGVKTLLEVTETLRHEVKSLLGAVGVLQSLVSQAKLDYANGQDPDGLKKGNRYLDLAQEVCADVRGHYPPETTSWLSGRALAIAMDLRLDKLFGRGEDMPHQPGVGDPGATLESASRHVSDMAVIEMQREEDERFLQSLDQITAKRTGGNTVKLFELRACWEEHYDCPDNGDIKVCDTYETIAFAIDDDTKLKEMADDLAAGYRGESWSRERLLQLRELYPNFDDFRDTEYKVVEVTELILPVAVEAASDS